MSEAAPGGPAYPVLAHFVNGGIHCFGLWYEHREVRRRGAGEQRLRIVPPVPGVVYDLETNRSLGHREWFEVTLPLEGRGVYAVVPYEIAPPGLQATGATGGDGLFRIACTATVGPTPATTENHVLRFALLDPGGREWSDLAVTATAREGRAEAEFTLPLNAPRGRWQIRCREALSGLSSSRTVDW